jgi:hypothetical protein
MDDVWLGELQRLSAFEQIRQVKARYLRGLDCGDGNLLRSAFAADIEVDFRGAATDPVSGTNHVPGATEGVLRGRDAAVAAFLTATASFTVVHHVSSPEMRLEGPDEASAIWPMVDRLRLGRAGATELVGFGYYFDRYVRVGDEWLIASMRIERLRVDVSRPRC